MVKHLPTTWETQVQSLGWDNLLEKEMATTPVFLPGKSHGRRSLAGYSPWGHKESATTEHISTNYSSLSLPSVYAACHILGTAAVFIIYFYIDDSVERGGPFQLSSVTQSCPTICDPMDYTVHGMLQIKILEWVAYPFSSRSSQPRN